MSTISKKVKVFVAFTIPSTIVSALTGGSSKTWITQSDAPVHFGVGPATSFFPEWYGATTNSRKDCAYNDEIVFSKDALDNILIAIDNKGQSFSTSATTYYGLSDGNGC